MKRTLALAVLLLATHKLALAQQCPRGEIDIASLTEQIYEAKDPHGAVIIRAAAIGGQSLVPALRQIAKPDKDLLSVAGAAQTALAKLGNQHAFAEIVDELNAHPAHVFHGTENAIYKLLYVANEKAIAVLLDFLAAHETQPIIVGYEVDDPYDLRTILIEGLGNIVENAPLKGEGNYKGTMDDWITWWKYDGGKPIPLSVGVDFSDPYSQCLERKFDWGFPMALLDLAATGDQRLVPAIQRIAATGYPLEVLSLNISPYPWLRHDYVEIALAKLGDQHNFDIVARQASPYPPDNTGLVKLKIIGGAKAMDALVALIPHIAPKSRPYAKPLMAGLSRMVQNPPLAPDAPPTEENLHKWQSWWTQNRSSAHFTPYTPFE